MWLGNEGYGTYQSTSSDRTLRKTCSVPSPYLLRTNSEKRSFQGFGRKKGATNCILSQERVQESEFFDILLTPFKKKGKDYGKN